ncbi:hypothetical protein JCM9279_004292 [Rhodotorula babjevae]
MDPLSATSKATGWSVPDFSLEARRPRTAATTQALSFAPRPVPTLYRPPDEEKGRAFRSRTDSASSSTLFGAPDPIHNKLDPPHDDVVQPLAAALEGALFSDDQDDDDLLDQFLADRGASQDQDDSGFVEQDVPSWSPRTIPAPVLSSSSKWTRAIDHAVFNADGNIQLIGEKLREVPNAVWELSTLRSFTPSSPSRSFARTQSVPASKLPSSPARRIFGRTSTVAFGSPGGSSSLAAGAVPVVLVLSGNELTAGALSNALWTIPNLQVLSLRNNHLDTLPEGVGRLAGLRELSLAGNRLQYLPAEILELDNLSNLTLYPNPWLPPPAPAPASVQDGDKASSTARSRRRKRVLGPLVTHYVVPSLVETCTRLLLSEATTSPVPPISLSASISSSSTAVRHIQNVRGGVEYVRALLDQRNLFAPFHSTFYPPSSLAASSSSSSSSLSPATSFFPRARQSSGPIHPAAPPTSQPYDPASHQCRSPAHPHDARVFVRHAVERLEWVSAARLRGRAARGEGEDGEGEVRDVPVRWRGCGPRCLDWLELDEEDEEEEQHGGAAEREQV